MSYLIFRSLTSSFSLPTLFFELFNDLLTSIKRKSQITEGYPYFAFYHLYLGVGGWRQKN